MKAGSFALLLAASCVGWTAGCGPSGPSVNAVAHQVKRLRADGAVAGETLLEPRAVSRFYQARGDRPAWSAGAARQIIDAIHDVAADGLDPAGYHLEDIERRDAADPGQRTASTQAGLDVLLTDAVAAMADHIEYGRVRPARLNPEWNVDPRAGAPPLERTVAEIARASSPRQAIASHRPRHFIYRGLVEALAQLRAIEAKGGWPVVPPGPALRVGARGPRVQALRARLAVTGELEGGHGVAGAAAFDDALREAVRRFQARQRLEPTGVVDRGTLEALEVSAGTRANQVRANLERARWVVGGLADDFLLVNLPAFKAYLIRGSRNVWEARTQIGQEALRTPTFRADMRTVVFNPDWTVPPTILAEEILEDMRNGKDVLTEKGLMMYDAQNQVVDPSTIDWNAATPEHFPYTLRQPAGDDNALGQVKFLFPNPYSIYLHDTPSRHLFEATRRTFSHGCIRLERPLELAELLLRDQGWDRGRIDRTLAEKQTEDVALEHPLPVLIVYWTVSVGASGEVHYASDIYHLDPPLLAALDAPGRTRLTASAGPR